MAGIIFVCLVPFAQEIYSFIATPMIDSLPEGQDMIATGVATPFLTPFKTTLFAALFFAMPVVIDGSFVGGLFPKDLACLDVE